MKTNKRNILYFACAAVTLIALAGLAMFIGVKVIQALTGGGHQESAYDSAVKLMPAISRRTATGNGSSGASREPAKKGNGKICPECMGIGYFDEHCFRCAGRSETLCHYCNGRGSKDCTSCGGTGSVYDFLSDRESWCRSCSGTGSRDCSFCMGGYETCMYCGGDGKIRTNCSKCGGDGYT